MATQRNVPHENDPHLPPPLPADRDTDDRDANPDAITGAPGSHPVGAGLGAAGGGAAGAAIGSVVPGVGTVAGGVVGAILGGIGGGYAGKGIAEAIDPTDENAYWREEYRNRPYVDDTLAYEEYEPAYRYGWEARCQAGDRDCRFEDFEPSLGERWDDQRGKSSLEWEQARPAAEDAWRRVDQRRSK